jgi:DNA-binding GntR family transcriptional regulator
MDAMTLAVATARSESTVSASQAVVEGVIAALDEGRLSPGQRLVEADLCLRFGVGRNAVREALQRLASEGVVELNRHRGATIREVPPDQALRILDLTELLVGLAARAAAQGVGAPGAAAQVRQALDRLTAAEHQDDDRPFVKARASFYAALLRIGGNQELQRIFPTVQVHVLRAQYHLTRLHRRLADDYQTIGEAVLRSDAAAAEAAGRSHVRRIRQHLERDTTSQEDSHG